MIPGVKKPVYCIPYEAPFSSLAFRDDGNTLAAGTNSGRVVFYDVRGRPQPFTILRAYSSSEVSTNYRAECCKSATLSTCLLQCIHFYLDYFVHQFQIVLTEYCGGLTCHTCLVLQFSLKNYVVCQVTTISRPKL